VAEEPRPELKVVGLTLPSVEANTPSETEEEAERQDKRITSLGDSIVLKTSSPAEFRDYLDYAAKQKKAVTLFLDGNDAGISPEAIDREAATLRFHLERNDDNKKIWSALLRNPFNRPQRPVEASVGLIGGVAVAAEQSTFTLKVVNWAWYAYAWLLVMALLLLSFGWLVARRGLLRDGPHPHPYSLGRCQMAWWFFLVMIGYGMIWLISGDQDTVTDSVLVLMGISAGTALSAALINPATGSAALSQAATDRLALQAAEQNAQQNVVAAQAAVAAAPADLVAQKQLADAQAALAVVRAR
jgi:hypothetical protein